ncbi:MAG: tetratricopeptide repeat protein [Candidatus Omnitrophota bacterium]
MQKTIKTIGVIIISIILILCLLSFFYFVVIIGAGSTGNPELPMLENYPNASLEYSLAKIHTKWLIFINGSAHRAFEERWQSGWAWFSRGKYHWAMKVFNRAWLINPKDARIFNAYGAIYDVQGEMQKAIEWYRRGAEKDDAKCQYNLAEQYFDGRVLKRNYAEAAMWYRLAADQDLNWALNMMGVCYEYGLGVPRNIEEAKKWYKKADEHENIPPDLLKLRGQTQSDIKEFQIPPEGEMIKE